MSGPMGGSCPACGRFWNARGCTPGNCKSTPEPAATTVGSMSDKLPPEWRVREVESRGLPLRREGLVMRAPEPEYAVVFESVAPETRARVWALVEAAPQMEALLRRVLVEVDDYRGELRELLTRIDERSKGG